ncbi:MAG TPA: SpoIIE family protein phosphatase [Xanthomonadaceae bacterium]|nr:SpoIIE family protein phosphatase [Xanthomonadaceae bacterium]
MPSLLITRGPGKGLVYSIDGAQVVGRGQFSDVRIDDPTVSRRHAEIRADGAAWELRDLGSSNGTLRNGHAVGEAAVRLDDGDKLCFGKVEAEFRLQDPVSATVVSGPTLGAGSKAAARLFQTMLGRTRLFCDFARQAATSTDAAALRTALIDRLREAMPGLRAVALLEPARVGQGFAVAEQRPPEARLPDDAVLAALASEAARQHAGWMALNDAEREDFHARSGHRLEAIRVMALSVRVAGELLGVLYVESDDDEYGLRGSDRDFLAGIAGLLGLAMAGREPAVGAQELRLARRIQQRFLPQGPPQPQGWRIVDSYTAAGAIGGDYYDFATLADGRLLVVVADVSGKGLPGALYMARLGLMVRREAPACRSPQDLLVTLNRLLCKEVEGGMFVTMAAIALDTTRGRFDFVSAGHPPALIRHVHEGSVDAIDAPSRPPLGADPTARYVAVDSQLQPGDLLLLYSDGLDEAINAEGERLGMPRVREILAECTGADRAVEALNQAVGEFAGQSPRADDLTLVCIEREH